MMFLQDFDLQFIHVLGTAMSPVDALSHLPNPDLSADNTDVTLLPADFSSLLLIQPLLIKYILLQ